LKEWRVSMFYQLNFLRRLRWGLFALLVAVTGVFLASISRGENFLSCGGRGKLFLQVFVPRM
jgi:hypothetical protein